jgi:hypothetical protein
VSGEIQTSLKLKFTVTYYPELDFLKQKWVMSAEWSRLDSIRPFPSCTEICVRGNTDISGIVRLQLTIRVTCDPGMTFSNRTGLFLKSTVHLTNFVPSSLAQRYVSGLIQSSLHITVTVIYDPELDFLKQNWGMSSKWSKFDSLPPFLSSSDLGVRGNTDISGINIYGYM